MALLIRENLPGKMDEGGSGVDVASDVPVSFPHLLSVSPFCSTQSKGKKGKLKHFLDKGSNVPSGPKVKLVPKKEKEKKKGSRDYGHPF